jgi:hypothetical protein
MLEDVIENTPDVVVATTPEPVGSEKDANGALLLFAYTAGVVGVTVAAVFGIGKLRKLYTERAEAKFEAKKAKYNKPLTNDEE